MSLCIERLFCINQLFYMFKTKCECLRPLSVNLGIPSTDLIFFNSCNHLHQISVLRVRG